VKIDVEFRSRVKRPAVSLILQDRRMVAISGRYYQISGETDKRDICKASIIFSFKAVLQEGHYFITLRLEDRISDRQFLLVDKQSGALYFEVARSGKREFLGIVDMSMDCFNAEDAYTKLISLQNS
jgi:hypothetical protein